MKEKGYIKWTAIEGRSPKEREEGRYGNTREIFFDAPHWERKNVLTEEEREYIKNIIAHINNEQKCDLAKFLKLIFVLSNENTINKINPTNGIENSIE